MSASIRHIGSPLGSRGGIRSVSGFGSGAAAAAFDPSHATGITFTNSNLTVANSGASTTNTRSTTSHTTGKYYIEATINSLHSPDNIGIGVVNSSFVFNGTSFVGSDNNGICMYTQGTGYINGGAALGWGTASAFGVGDVLQIAIDLDNQKIHYRINGGGFWNTVPGDDPATNTGGSPLSPLGGGAIYVAADLETTSGNRLTVNFGATSYAFTAPSGFGAW